MLFWPPVLALHQAASDCALIAQPKHACGAPHSEGKTCLWHDQFGAEIPAMAVATLNAAETKEHKPADINLWTMSGHLLPYDMVLGIELRLLWSSNRWDSQNQGRGTGGCTSTKLHCSLVCRLRKSCVLLLVPIGLGKAPARAATRTTRSICHTPHWWRLKSVLHFC